MINFMEENNLFFLLSLQSGAHLTTSKSVAQAVCNSTESRRSANQMTEGLSDLPAACRLQDNKYQPIGRELPLMKAGLSSLFCLEVKKKKLEDNIRAHKALSWPEMQFSLFVMGKGINTSHQR